METTRLLEPSLRKVPEAETAGHWRELERLSSDFIIFIVQSHIRLLQNGFQRSQEHCVEPDLV